MSMGCRGGRQKVTDECVGVAWRGRTYEECSCVLRKCARMRMVLVSLAIGVRVCERATRRESGRAGDGLRLCGCAEAREEPRAAQ